MKLTSNQKGFIVLSVVILSSFPLHYWQWILTVEELPVQELWNLPFVGNRDWSFPGISCQKKILPSASYHVPHVFQGAIKGYDIVSINVTLHFSPEPSFMSISKDINTFSVAYLQEDTNGPSSAISPLLRKVDITKSNLYFNGYDMNTAQRDDGTAYHARKSIYGVFYHVLVGILPIHPSNIFPFVQHA